MSFLNFVVYSWIYTKFNREVPCNSRKKINVAAKPGNITAKLEKVAGKYEIAKWEINQPGRSQMNQ